MKKEIAFFDLDGTITSKDSFIDFLIFSQGYFKFYTIAFLLSPIIMAYFLKIASNEILKKSFVRCFFKGMNKDKYLSITKQYSQHKLPELIIASAKKRIEWHKEKGDDVVIVSASLYDYIKYWTDINKVKLIATHLEFIDNICTGKLLTKNCNGIEKARRIQVEYNISDYKCIYAYGNSSGDKEMLKLADKLYYKFF